MEKKRQVIHLYIKATEEHYYFGSLQALYQHFTSDQLGVAKQTLYNQWKTNVWSNDLIDIRRGELVASKSTNMAR